VGAPQHIVGLVYVEYPPIHDICEHTKNTHQLMMNASNTRYTSHGGYHIRGVGGVLYIEYCLLLKAYHVRVIYKSYTSCTQLSTNHIRVVLFVELSTNHIRVVLFVIKGKSCTSYLQIIYELYTIIKGKSYTSHLQIIYELYTSHIRVMMCVICEEWWVSYTLITICY